jgi:DMSO/TMAO reductase YedYZ heme-binding membrane subunit
VSHIWWYVARGAGLTAWALLMVSVVLGVALSGRLAGSPATRRRIRELHPWVAGAALGALGAHVIAVVADSYVDLGPIQALVPGASPYEPVAVALGAVSLWMLVAVQLTSVARRRMSRRAWRGVHLLGYVVAVLMTVHALAAGTDARNPLLALPMVTAVLVAALMAWERVTTRSPTRLSPPAHPSPPAREPVPPLVGSPPCPAPTAPGAPPAEPATTSVARSRASWHPGSAAARPSGW